MLQQYFELEKIFSLYDILEGTSALMYKSLIFHAYCFFKYVKFTTFFFLRPQKVKTYVINNNKKKHFPIESIKYICICTYKKIFIII